MEMPEGWEIAKDCDTSTDSGKERIDYALNLMKEMAEALESINQYNEEMIKSSNYIRYQSSEPLKKFKEWK